MKNYIKKKRNVAKDSSKLYNEKAIKYCEELLENYDTGGDIDDIDVAYIIEILKGRD